MEMTNQTTTPIVTKETKKKIQVDYEGKLTVKERLMKKLSESNTWIKAGVNVLRFILMLGISFVIIYPFIARIAGSFMTYNDVIDSTVAIIPKTPTLEIYKAIIAENNYLEALKNTALLSLICALIQTLISCWIGYGIAKFKFKGNKIKGRENQMTNQKCGPMAILKELSHPPLQRWELIYVQSQHFLKLILQAT